MTRNALSIEVVGRRANNVLLPHSIQAWGNDCWSNKVIEEQLDQRHIPPSKLEQYCMGCWSGLITDRYLPQRLNSHQRHIPCGTLNSSARVDYRAHTWLGEFSDNIIVKHRHGLVTDCHHLPMVPIVSQSAPMVSVADVSVKLYYQVIIQTIMLSSISIMLIYALTPSFRIYIRDIYEIYMRYIYISLLR